MYWLLAITYFSLTVHAYDYGNNYRTAYRDNYKLSFDDQTTYNPCQVGSGVYFHPNPTNIHEYYQCDDFGTAHLQSCGDLVWDVLRTTCNWPNAVLIESPSSTSSSPTTTTTEEASTTTEDSATNKTISSSLCDVNNPCGEHGHCIEVFGTALTGTRKFACICDKHWFGRFCDKPIDELTTPALTLDETHDNAQTEETAVVDIHTEIESTSSSSITTTVTDTTTVSVTSICEIFNPCGEHGQCTELVTTDNSSSLHIGCICDENWSGPLCDKHAEELTTSSSDIGELEDETETSETAAVDIHADDDSQPSPSTTTTTFATTTTTASSFSLCAQMNPCGEHGQCSDLSTADASSSLRISCICDKDWSGPLCEKHIGDLEKPVVNINVNVDQDKKKMPTTVSSTSLCAQMNPCGEHGQCSDLSTTDTSSGIQISCICDKDWSGPLCDKHVGDLEKPVVNVNINVNQNKKKMTTTTVSSTSLCAQMNLCGEHGQCTESGTTDGSSDLHILCICDENWSGPFCDQRVDNIKKSAVNVHVDEDKKKITTTTTTTVAPISLCDTNNPCGEHGQCVPTHPTVLSAEPQTACICEENWFGRLCDKRIDELTTPSLSLDQVKNSTQPRETFSLPVYTKDDAKYIFYGLKGDNKIKLAASLKKRMMDPKEQKDGKEKKLSIRQIPFNRANIRITRGDMK